MRAPWLREAQLPRLPQQMEEAQATSADVPLETTTASLTAKAPEIDIEASLAASTPDDDKLRPNENAQAGVKAAEAVTISWSKRALVGAFAKYVKALPLSALRACRR